jgi:hypothetical protein
MFTILSQEPDGSHRVAGPLYRVGVNGPLYIVVCDEEDIEPLVVALNANVKEG